jgi:hypothetical protein
LFERVGIGSPYLIGAALMVVAVVLLQAAALEPRQAVVTSP